MNEGPKRFWACAVMRHRLIAIVLNLSLPLVLGGCVTVQGLHALGLVSDSDYYEHQKRLDEAWCATFNTSQCSKIIHAEQVPDYVRIANLHRENADKGDAEAQNALGLDYEQGMGVPQDYAEAAKWYREAANQGYAEAQSNLGSMYANGRGVPQDIVTAYKWSTLAAAGGYSAWYRDYLEKKMTPAQIAEAKKQASEWTPTRTTAPAASTAPDAAPSPNPSAPSHSQIGPV